MLRSGLLLFALVFCLVGAAQAKEYQFTFVTMDIPDSCHFMPREGAIFVQDDNNHFFTLDIKPVDAATDPAAYAATLAANQNGGAVRAADGAWSFNVTGRSVPYAVTVLADADHMITMYTDMRRAQWPEDLKTALNSAKGKDPAVDALLRRIIAVPESRLFLRIGILNGHGTLVPTLNRANELRLRLHGGRLLTQPSGHCKIVMP